jgi:hypothetical protein
MFLNFEDIRNSKEVFNCIQIKVKKTDQILHMMILSIP